MASYIEVKERNFSQKLNQIILCLTISVFEF